MAAILRDLALDAKAFVQPLGVENCWSDLGEGVVELVGSTLRVRAASDAAASTRSAAADDEAEGEDPEAAMVLLEDTLERDTQLVGRDSCIVWNSAEQQMSFCVMFNSDLGYEATHSACVFATKGELLPGWDVDFFQSMQAATQTAALFAAAVSKALEGAAQLGFIHRHALAASFIASEYHKLKGVLANAELCRRLVGLAHPAVLHCLVQDGAWQSVAAALHVPSSDVSYDVPKPLLELPDVRAISDAMTCANRLATIVSDDEATSACVQEAVSRAHRSVVFATTGLPLAPEEPASSEDSEALPPPAPFFVGVATGLLQVEPRSKEPEAVAHAVAYTRCCADVIDLALRVLGKEALGVVIARVFVPNMLAGLAAVAKRLTLNFDAELHVAFCRVLDHAVVAANQKGDDDTLNRCVRNPIVAASREQGDSFAPLVKYLCTVRESPRPTSFAHSLLACDATSAASHGLHYLFHMLGLHDDEGTTIDRYADAESVADRAAFHVYFTTNHVYYLLSGDILSEAAANLIEYMLRLCAGETRDRLVLMLLSSRSPLCALIAKAGPRPKAQLCAHIRLLRSLVMGVGALPERAAMVPLLHRLSFGTDVFGAVAHRLNRCRRASSMAHCVFRSALEAIDGEALRPLQRYLVVRHRDTLPTEFVTAVDAQELASLANALNAEGFQSPVPFMSPSRAVSPADTSSVRRQRMVDEVADVDESPPRSRSTSPAFANRLRSIIAKQQGEAKIEAARASPLDATTVSTGSTSPKTLPLQPPIDAQHPAPPKGGPPPKVRRPTAPQGRKSSVPRKGVTQS